MEIIKSPTWTTALSKLPGSMPSKTSYEMENYPAPSAAQLLTMPLHREHCCSYFYYTQFSEKNQPIPGLSNYFQMSLFQYPQNKLHVLWTYFLILIG